MDIINSLLEWLQGIADKAVDLLPDSPFQALDNTLVKDFLPYLNWFFPVSFMISTMELWLSAIATYYLISIVLRWLKAID